MASDSCHTGSPSPTAAQYPARRSKYTLWPDSPAVWFHSCKAVCSHDLHVGCKDLASCTSVGRASCASHDAQRPSGILLVHALPQHSGGRAVRSCTPPHHTNIHHHPAGQSSVCFLFARCAGGASQHCNTLLIIIIPRHPSTTGEKPIVYDREWRTHVPNPNLLRVNVGSGADAIPTALTDLVWDCGAYSPEQRPSMREVSRAGRGEQGGGAARVLCWGRLCCAALCCAVRKGTNGRWFAEGERPAWSGCRDMFWRLHT